MESGEKKKYLQFIFLLRQLIIPHSQPWQLADYNRLCQVYPLLTGYLSRKATISEWTKAGADVIIAYMISKNRLVKPTQNFMDSCLFGHVEVAKLLHPYTSMMRHSIIDLFQEVCANGHLPMAMWMFKTLLNTSREAKTISEIGRASCRERV